MSMAASAISVSKTRSSRSFLPLVILFLLAIGVCILRYAIDRAPGGSVTLAWPQPEWAMFRRTSIFAGIIVGGGGLLAWREAVNRRASKGITPSADNPSAASSTPSQG